jgi:ferredoxin--NADP+ reductase
MVGEELSPENTIIYICGYQGTIDGVIEHLNSKGFVTEHEKKPDGSFGIKFESYG